MKSRCMMHLEKTGINIHHLIDTTVDELGSDIYPMSDVTELSILTLGNIHLGEFFKNQHTWFYPPPHLNQTH